MTSIPEAICRRMAGRGSSIPISTIVSSRLNISAGLLACPVLKLPSCPVFSACSISMASAPRTSPTMIRSGRIRRAERIRSRMVTSPLPSTLAFLASRLTRLGTSRILSSALSSMVITHHKTYACYNCLENSVFTRNTDIFLHKKSTLYFKSANYFYVYFMFYAFLFNNTSSAFVASRFFSSNA